MTQNKVCLIAPYAEMADMARELKKETSFDFDIKIGSLEKGVLLARDAKQAGAEIIISRGGTAAAIRKQVNVPVVEIKVTGYDVLRALSSRWEKKEPVFIVGFENVVEGCRAACNILGIPTYEMIIASDGREIDWTSVHDKVQALIDKYNIKTIIGDNMAVNRLNFRIGFASLITSGKEALLQAFDEAESMLGIREEEKKKTERFQTILNFVHDGVIATDETGTITVINPLAEKIFAIQKDQAIGRPIEQVIPNTRIHKVLASTNPELGQVQKSPKGHVLTNRIPIIVDNKVKGIVATFQEVSKIQDDERKIRQNLYAKGLFPKYNFNDIISEDAQVKRLIQVAKDYSQTDATILILGENGVGKEMFAQSIHASSKRAKGPFVAINCSALPPQLLESELFGYTEGAFTGAKKGGKIGLFELAHTGSIFLDEIGDVSTEVQASMLRVLEEKKVMRLGSDAVIPVDVRVIAATNVDLKRRINQGSFRMDLFYRLNVLSLTVPPLRQRKGDIALLAKYFIRELGHKYNRRVEKLPGEIVELLTQHNWPGNIRELRNIIERMILSEQDGKIVPADVAAMMEELKPYQPGEQELGQLLSCTMNEIKQRVIMMVLKEEGYNKSRTAKRLGIDRATVERFL
ncbi:MAG: sigma 54-interacting transcriptional regulator [Negativicutes bacterium]|nr:sigma 54-interacting transcriptional regulator [Negativicutes bacterium]